MDSLLSKDRPHTSIPKAISASGKVQRQPRVMPLHEDVQYALGCAEDSWNYYGSSKLKNLSDHDGRSSYQPDAGSRRSRVEYTQRNGNLPRDSHKHNSRHRRETFRFASGQRSRDSSLLLKSTVPSSHQVQARGSCSIDSPSSLSRSLDLSYMGAWCDTIEQHHSSVLEEPPVEIQWRSGDGPRAPKGEPLATPDLAALSTDFSFCACSDGTDDNIGGQWHMTAKEKMDAQRECYSRHIYESRC